MTTIRSPVDNRELLRRLTALAVRLEAGAAVSLFRFGASRAYAEIVEGRLRAIDEAPLSGFTSLSGFLSRRFSPAMRTCKTMGCDRQAGLSHNLGRTAQLLRTRVEVDLQQQNRDLLSSMNTRTSLQFRLQETVEIPVHRRGQLLRRGAVGSRLRRGADVVPRGDQPEVADGVERAGRGCRPAGGFFFGLRIRAIRRHAG